ncbi:MAG TPA: hypothetical protein VF934_13685 [Burkholderiales bacterium]|jgi:hypothetical protein
MRSIEPDMKAAPEAPLFLLLAGKSSARTSTRPLLRLCDLVNCIAQMDSVEFLQPRQLHITD